MKAGAQQAARRGRPVQIPAAWCTGDYFTAPVRAWKGMQFEPQMPHVVPPSVLGRPAVQSTSGVANYTAEQRRANSGFSRHGLGLGGSTPKPVEMLTVRPARQRSVRDPVLAALKEVGRKGMTAAELADKVDRSPDNVGHVLAALQRLGVADSWPGPCGYAQLRKRWWAKEYLPAKAPVPTALARER